MQVYLSLMLKGLNIKGNFPMFSNILVVSTGYILLTSICPMLKAGKLQSMASSAIVAKGCKSLARLKTRKPSKSRKSRKFFSKFLI